ncbi:MAG: ABC transporter permease [Saprospiraceae bacterium]|nr:ABC transporter permease [Saprospiraceae bacterium]
MHNPLRHSLRVLLKYRLYTGFALIGLSVAITSVWFIANYLKTSYQYDVFHTQHREIYRLSMEVTAGDHTDHYATTGKPLGEFLHKNYTGIEGYAKLKFHPSTLFIDGKAFQEQGFFQANPQALSIFSFNFLAGDHNALSQPDAIVLTESLAIKYFGKVDIIGKQVRVEEKTYNIAGVFQDWPQNSHIQVNALLSETVDPAYDVQSWFDIEQYTYVLANPSLQQEELQSRLDQLVADQLAPLIEGSGVEVSFNAQALSEIHFSPALVDDVQKGSRVYINALAMAGLLVLIIALLNFINLTLTRSTQRTKEIRVKKVLGISRRQLVMQSVVESLAMTVLVTTLSIVLILFGEKFYTAYTGFEAISLVSNKFLMLLLSLLVFGCGLVGSTYSGVYLSFSSPSVSQEGPRILLLKKLLLGFQYSIAILVLILTLSMGRQLDFLLTKDLGFDQEEILILRLPEGEEERSSAITFREQLRSRSSIQNASLIGGGAIPGEENGKDIFEVYQEGSKTEKIYNIYRVDEVYFDLLNIPFATGRNFNPTQRTDEEGGVIINETLARSLNWEKPLGREIGYGGEKRKVIGVVKDFHNKSLHNLIEPIVFLFETAQPNNLLVKASATELTTLQSEWQEFYIGAPFSVTHFDRFIGNMYDKEKQLTQLFQFFSFISLLLCYMGLFALFSLHVQQRTKEMSVRKVLGAELGNLFAAIIKNYGRIVFFSMLASIPIGWYLVKVWLAEFSFSAQVGLGVYLLAGFIVISTSLLVISYHIIKIINVNPVLALKHE